jgi:hypothetical protein
MMVSSNPPSELKKAFLWKFYLLTEHSATSFALRHKWTRPGLFAVILNIASSETSNTYIFAWDGNFLARFSTIGYPIVPRPIKPTVVYVKDMMMTRFERSGHGMTCLFIICWFESNDYKYINGPR